MNMNMRLMLRLSLENERANGTGQPNLTRDTKLCKTGKNMFLSLVGQKLDLQPQTVDTQSAC